MTNWGATPCDPRIALLSRAPAMLRGRLVTAATPVWPAKDPQTTEFRAVDFGLMLDGRQIASAATAASGVTISAVTVTGSLVSLILTGGADGVPARVEVTAQCGDGTDVPAAVLLPIVSTLTLPPEGDVTPATFSTTTAGITPGALGALPIIAPSGASIGVRGEVIARNLGTGDTASWDLAAVIKGWGTQQASIPQQGAPPYQADPALQSCTVTVAVAGALVTVIVTGVAGSVLTWSANLTWATA